LVALLALTSSVAIAENAPPTSVSKHLAKILTRGDGNSEQTAYRVKSVHEEYELLAALGLKPGKQSLVLKKKPYDVVEGTDERTGATREVWFDISSFYPEF
jgi:hypothetical protein